MATREELQLQFSDLGVEPSDDVLDKCVEICVLNNIDVEEFVETWMAFSLSHLNGAEPTVEYVLQMERHEFVKREASTPQLSTTPLRIFNNSVNNGSILEDDTNMECLIPITPKARTPYSRGINPSKSPRNLFSPASYSPDVGTSCSNYKERQNAGQVVLSQGDGVDHINWSVSNKRNVDNPVKIFVDKMSDQQIIKNLKNKLMMESLAVKADIYNDHIEGLGKIVMKDHLLDEPSQFRHPCSEKFVTYGRIFSSESKLQQNSAHLESSEMFSLGLTIELNLQQLVRPNITCSGLFPGQVVAVEGVNPLGDKIIAHKIFSPNPPPLAEKPVIEEQFPIFIAAGPFTQADNLLYEPLEDFLSVIKKEEPQLAIIIGPLVDFNHPMIVDGSLAETYEEFYLKVLSQIMDQLKGCSTQVVIVASARDAAQSPVYPVVPVNIKEYPNLLTIGDPSMIEINGVVIGISAMDILLHLSREEMPLPSQNGGDRLGRMASHLLSQRNFYPLHPSADDVSLDASLWENMCNITVTPHILVLPSDLRYFIKNVGDCVVVNPERLAKGQAGGSYARLLVKPSKEINDWLPTTHIAGQILKI